MRAPLLILLGGLCLTACGATAHQYAIVADQGFSTTVFAFDDAERAYCAVPTASQTTCAQLNLLVIKALTDVKAVSQAIQDTPGGFPHDLPDLLADLAQIQTTLNDLTPVNGTLASRLAAANMKATALLTQLMGGTQ